jgi:hypothetical protein
MASETDEAVEELVGAGLAKASESEILRLLDAELQQQSEASALVLSGEAPEPWVLGGPAAGGFGSLARRFLTFYSAAMRRELCDAKGAGLNTRYAEQLGGQAIPAQLKVIAPLILTAFEASTALVAPGTVAAIVALWLVRVGIERWCAAPEDEGRG